MHHADVLHTLRLFFLNIFFNLLDIHGIADEILGAGTVDHDEGDDCGHGRNGFNAAEFFFFHTLSISSFLIS